MLERFAAAALEKTVTLPTEQKENITTVIERFAQASIHGVYVIPLISVIGDRFDKLATLFDFFLSMIFAESGNQHFQNPAIYFIIRVRYQGIGNLACAKEEIPDLRYLDSNVGNGRA
jgi:hypothetical protein